MSASARVAVPMTATLLVSGCAPPTPSICRASGEPIAASKTRSRAEGETGRSLARKYSPLDVPPRMSVHGMPRNTLSVLLGPAAIDEAAGSQLLAHIVDVETELAALQALPHLRFAGVALFARPEHRARLEPRHHADSVIIGDDDISGVNHRSAAGNGHVDRAQSLLDGALGMDGAGPDGKLHHREIADIAHAGLDDQPSNAAAHQRTGQQLAEISCVRAGGGHNDEHVARAALLDCDVDHPVVRRWQADRNGAAGNAGPRKDRPQMRTQEPGAALSLMDGGHTKTRQPFDEVGFSPLDVGMDDAHRWPRGSAGSSAVWTSADRCPVRARQDLGFTPQPAGYPGHACLNGAEGAGRYIHAA